MEVKELVQNCAENQGLKSGLLVLFGSVFSAWTVSLFNVSFFFFFFSLNSFNKRETFTAFQAMC